VASSSHVDDDEQLLQRLRAGDEQAFASLVNRYHGGLMRVARSYVSTREAAEDVVQDTFVAVVKGIERFEGRSSVKTWMFRILVNRAQTRGERDGRSRPLSSLADDGSPTVDPDRFEKAGRWAGTWSSPPSHEAMPEANLLADELGGRLRAVIDELPEVQRAVLELRDVQGLSSMEVCELLDLSEANQRVLLHRARSRARAMLEDYVRDERRH
jgi:RNA polymerase sigma-70 factor (ECF subfamily)